MNVSLRIFIVLLPHNMFVELLTCHTSDCGAMYTVETSTRMAVYLLHIYVLIKPPGVNKIYVISHFFVFSKWPHREIK